LRAHADFDNDNAEICHLDDHYGDSALEAHQSIKAIHEAFALVLSLLGAPGLLPSRLRTVQSEGNLRKGRAADSSTIRRAACGVTLSDFATMPADTSGVAMTSSISSGSFDDIRRPSSFRSNRVRASASGHALSFFHLIFQKVISESESVKRRKSRRKISN
jgi:hypothetical protein